MTRYSISILKDKGENIITSSNIDAHPESYYVNEETHDRINLNNQWTQTKILQFKRKLDSFTTSIYHSSRYGRHSLCILVPLSQLIYYANAVFHTNCWEMQVVNVQTSVTKKIANTYSILTEANVMISFKGDIVAQSGGFSCISTESVEVDREKTEKNAIDDALKQALLSLLN